MEIREIAKMFQGHLALVSRHVNNNARPQATRDVDEATQMRYESSDRDRRIDSKDSIVSSLLRSGVSVLGSK